jgi:hypothetical protein
MRDEYVQQGISTVSTDEVNNPKHYTSGKIECIEAIEAALTPEELKGFLKGNIIKYTWRERHKGGVQSLEKAQWYLNRLLASPTPNPQTDSYLDAYDKVEAFYSNRNFGQ